MNKKMEELYAEANTIGRWIDDLKVIIDTDPDAHMKEQDIMIACGFRIIAITKEIDKERKVYLNRPLWKKLIGK